MTTNNKAILIKVWGEFVKRFKTFAWYAGMQILLISLNVLAENAGLIGLPDLAVVFIGLAASQVTKYLNS